MNGVSAVGTIVLFVLCMVLLLTAIILIRALMFKPRRQATEEDRTKPSTA